MNPMDMSGKVALVTGAAGGIGNATALMFAGVGAQVAITDINEEGLEKTRRALEDLGAKAVAVPCDITDFGAVTSMVGAVLAKTGRLDALANVAGGGRTEPFIEQDPERWHGTLARNLWGTVYCSRAVLDDMFERKSGSIVNVASDAGRVGSLGETVYAAAKGGVISFTKSLAREMARHGIRVNCVSPGPTDTDQTQTALRDHPKVMEKMVSAIAMKRIGRPEEQAAVIVFLASDAASYVTGQVLSVNGGLQMV